MLKALPLHVAAGVCALVVATAAPLYAQPDLKRWYFAEGSTNETFGFEQEILIGNPTAQTANVVLRFFPQDGSAPIVGSLGVEPYSRHGVLARQFVGHAYGVALEVTSSADIVVERSMYWGDGLFNFGPNYPYRNRPTPWPITDLRGGHNVMGVNAPALSWSFAEGAAGGPLGFHTYVLVSNPSLTEAANVKVTYFTSQGEQVLDLDSGLLGPGQRRTYVANISLDATLLTRPQYDFAIEVTSDNGVPVVAERAMYWGPDLRGGHAAVGVQPDSVWYFAEGIQGASPINFDTFLLLYNPSATEAIDVQVDFFGKLGLATSKSVTVQPRTRENVWAAQFPELTGENSAFSVRAVNTLGKPFVAERAVYWKGMREGTVSAGTPQAARKWGFADGQEGGFLQFQNPADPNPRHFSTYYLILNNTPNPVPVRGVFYVEGQPGAGQEVTITVPALSRETISPSSLPGLHNKKFAAFFEATDEVIVERALYWGAGFVGGHGSAGAVLPDSLPTLPAPVAPAGPALTAITPARGTPGGGTPVVITGSGIGLTDSPVGQTTVHFGITPTPIQNITVLNANQIRVVTPPSGKGLASVIVSTRGTTVELPAAFEFFDKYAATGAPMARYNGADKFTTCTTGSGERCAELGSVVGPYHLEGLVQSVAASRQSDLFNSCHERGGNNRFMFEVVAELRKLTGTNRWGVNWKRGNIGDLSQDVITYFWGEEGEIMSNSPKIFLVDVIGNHCPTRGFPDGVWFGVTWPTFFNDNPELRDVPPNRPNGRWTVQELCKDSRYRDATHNGQFLFPECQP